jgi:hypothetical protein
MRWYAGVPLNYRTGGHERNSRLVKWFAVSDVVTAGCGANESVFGRVERKHRRVSAHGVGTGFQSSIGTNHSCIDAVVGATAQMGIAMHYLHFDTRI